MLEKITRHWNQFRRYPPGERFERYYRYRHESRRSPVKKVLLIGLGGLIVVAGIIFLATPGPGLLVLLIGAGLIARESLQLSRLFDRLEPRVWRGVGWCRTNWQRLSLSTRILVLAVAAIPVLLTLYPTYKIFFK
jgi:hypothetical protein